MKPTKLMLAVAAVTFVVMLFCVNTLMRQGNSHPVPTGDDCILEDAPVQKTEPRQGGRQPQEPPNTQTLKTAADDPAVFTATDEAQEKVRIEISQPKPALRGMPYNPRSSFNLERLRDGQPYPAILVPPGCDVLLSLNCEVTSSDPDPIIGELSYITDGNKEWSASSYVELGAGTQWVQIDLGEEREIYGACVWHYYYVPRVYRDVICQISNDPDFVDGVVTVFNNDHDNSSGLGIGKDKEYFETPEGRPFPINAVKGRYVRFYSRGSNDNEMNHYIEIEIYGKDD